MPFSNFRFLIVDDDISHLDELDAKLKALNASHVFRSDCGENAVATMLSMEKPVDCVLCNYGMPRGNGLQVLQYIRMGRVKTLRPDACVLVFSGDRAPPIIKAAGELDVSGYLITPFSAPQLVAAVTKGRSRYFKADFSRYATVAIPDYIAGGVHQTESDAGPAKEIVAEDTGDSGRRAMADLITQSLRAKKQTAAQEGQ